MRVWMVVLFLLSGCTGHAVQETFSEEGPLPQVWFCIPDDCATQLAVLLKSANTSIHCAFYDLDLEHIIEVLKKKRTSIDVKVVLDNEPYSNALQGPGVLIEDRPSRMHNKFCIVDSRHVWTGSFNPTSNDNDQNENNAILIESHYLAQNYEEEFEELWNKEFSGGQKVAYPWFWHNDVLVENLFCPEDGCEQKTIQLIAQAQQSVDALLFSFTSEPIADALLFNLDAKSRVLFDVTQAGSKYSQDDRLMEFGMEVRIEKQKGKLHHKVFIIDNATVITGSYNPSSSGTSYNDENVLIIHDAGIAKQFAEEFNRLWQKSE